MTFTRSTNRRSTNVMQNNKPWEQLARRYAKEMHEENFKSHRGWFPLDCGEGDTKLVLYNNNPYACGPGLRERETAALRAWLSEQGIAELGYATHPNTGEDAGYSYAMILDVPASLHPQVVAKLEEFTRKSRGDKAWAHYRLTVSPMASA
jgi:hypothetical protein